MKRSAACRLAGLALVILAAAMALLYVHTRPQTSEGSKTISVAVTHLDGTQRDFTLQTDAATLWGAMEEAGLIAGTDSAYGKWVSQVDGETADGTANQWWVFTRGGQWVDTACDATPIADGETYEFTILAG